MSTITVSAGQIPGYRGDDATVKLRIYADQTFTDADGTPVIGGAVGTDRFYQELDCTVDPDGTVQFPTFDIQSTEDGEPSDSTYSFAVFTDDGEHLVTVYQDFRIAGDHPSPTTLGDIAEYNAAEPACLDNLYYTAAQVDAIIAGLSSTAVKMTEVIYGVGKLSHAAALISAPIVMSHNDPLMRQMRETYYLESYGHTVAGCQAAIAEIGSAQATLVFTKDVPISSASVTFPDNILLKPEGNGRFTMSGGNTLTYAMIDAHPGVKIFYGVDASNHVICTRSAAPLHLSNYMGIESTSDCSYAMADMITSATEAGGGLGIIHTGTWKMDNVRLSNAAAFRLQGAGQGFDGTTGTVLVRNGSSAGYIIDFDQGFRGNSIADLTISTGNLTNTNALKVHGVGGGSSGFGAHFERVTFFSNGAVATGAVPQVYFKYDTTAGYEIVMASFKNCKFINCDASTAFYCDAFNTQVHFDSCSFETGKGASNSVHLVQALSVKFTACDFRGQVGTFTETTVSPTGDIYGTITNGGYTLTAVNGTFFRIDDVGMPLYRAGSIVGAGGVGKNRIASLNSSTEAVLVHPATATLTGTDKLISMYRFGESTDKAGCAIRASEVGMLTVEACQFEGYNKDLSVDLGLVYPTPITLINNVFQSKINLDASCVINSTGNKYYSLAFNDGASAGGRIISTGDTIEARSMYGDVLTKAKFWGPDHEGVTLIGHQIGFESGIYTQQFGYHTRFRVGADSSSLERPVVSITSQHNVSGEDGQILLQLGFEDPTTEAFKWGWNFRREPATGWMRIRSIQEALYGSWTWDTAIGYEDTARVNVTQATNRTTAVTANGIHGTITTHTASLAAGAFAVFTFNNSLLQNGDELAIWLQDGSVHDETTVDIVRAAGAVAKIMVKNNHSSTAETGALKIGYAIRRGGKQDGTTTL